MRDPGNLSECCQWPSHSFHLLFLTWMLVSRLWQVAHWATLQQSQEGAKWRVQAPEMCAWYWVPLGALVEKPPAALVAAIQSQMGNVLFWNLVAWFCLFMDPRLEPNVSQVLGKCSTIKLHPKIRESVSYIKRRKKKKWNKTKQGMLPDRDYLPTPEIHT